MAEGGKTFLIEGEAVRGCLAKDIKLYQIEQKTGYSASAEDGAALSPSQTFEAPQSCPEALSNLASLA